MTYQKLTTDNLIKLIVTEIGVPLPKYDYELKKYTYEVPENVVTLDDISRSQISKNQENFKAACFGIISWHMKNFGNFRVNLFCFKTELPFLIPQIMLFGENLMKSEPYERKKILEKESDHHFKSFGEYLISNERLSDILNNMPLEHTPQDLFNSLADITEKDFDKWLIQYYNLK